MTGTLNPDQTGIYWFDYVDGDGYDVFKKEASPWYIWHEEIPMEWTLSQDVGEHGSAWWTHPEASPLGTYDPYGTATGDATVANDT